MAEELSTIYRQIAEGNGKQYEFLLSLEEFFLSVMDFDPVTDESLPVIVDDVLYGLASSDFQKSNFQNDRLQHIVNFVSSAVRNLIDILHEKNLREHRITRPEQVREVDSKSMMWLAKKPGFTVKQKIASEQRMMGVYHTTSLDTAENRLFKAFLQKLDELLLEKENAFRKMGLVISDDAERFASTVHRWLKSDESELIGRWNNTPPNNTLLNDKNYRKIWKAHLMLQNLNEQVQSDLENFDRLKIRALFWITAARLNLSRNVRFRQNLLFCDYKDFSFRNSAQTIRHSERSEESLTGFAKTASWGKLSFSANAEALLLTLDEKETEYYLPDEIKNLSDLKSYSEQICKDFFPNMNFESSHTENKNRHSELISESVSQTNIVAAVDLNSVLPTFTLGDKTQGRFSRKILHQSIFVKEKELWFPCSASRSKLIFTKSKDIKTFSVHSIFDEKLRSQIDSDEYRNAIEKACSDFAKTIKEELHCQKCLYVTSDDSDDFSPSVNAFKHSMNSAFSKTEIVPRSIAALFSLLPDIQNRFQKGDEITVRTIYDDYEIRTRIRIKFDEELLKKNPETKGISFQRLGFERIEQENHLSKYYVPKNLSSIFTRQDANLLQEKFSTDDFHFESQVQMGKILKKNSEILVCLKDDTSSGAIEYERLQKITPEIPLWCDFLPKLSMVDSTGKEYVLVEPEKVSIRPIVGEPVRIPISWKFSFPAHKSFYEFLLIQGEKKEKSKYFAFIKDSSFPLENVTECSLYLTYTYGMPLPYSLEFLSISDSAEFKSVVVKWENKSHKDYVHDMPVPNFVREYTWEDMKSVPGRKRDGKIENSDLISDGEWLPTEFKKINKLASGKIKICKLDSVETIGVSEKGKEYRIGILLPNGKITYQDFSTRQRINEDSFVACEFSEQIDFFGNKVEKINKYRTKPTNTFFKSLRFPALMVWNNGRSIYDEDCPHKENDTDKIQFREQVEYVLKSLEKTFSSSVPEEMKHEQMFLLSCMHKDMPDWFSQFLPKILSSVENHYDYPNWIAYALGDCTTVWQKNLLSKTIDLLDDDRKSIFAIKILAKALWRVNSFVFNLAYDDVEKLISTIRLEIQNTQDLDSMFFAKRTYNQQERIAIFSACLECLVALCRLRKTKDNKSSDDEMLNMLSPSENENIKQIVGMLKNMKNKDIKIKTFLTFEIDRSSDDQTPELLFAAYGYLSGAIDSNSIRVLEADFGE